MANPDADIVVREVTENVWTFSKPFTRSGLFPFGGRSTAVKLSSGDVWVLASTPLTPGTKEKLDSLGTVRYIMCADAVHNMFLGDFKRAYPDAKLVGVEPVLAKPHLKDVEFAGAYGKDAPDTKYGFEDEIQPCFFSGYKMKDMAFLHPKSRTLIVADLLFNLPAHEQYSKSKSSGSFPLISALSPYAYLHKWLVWGQGADKDAMRRDAKTVASWDFERIIPCHGDVIEKDAKKAWAEAYKWYLK